MAVDALVKRHLAAPTNPIDTFSVEFLTLLTEPVRQQHQSLCAFDNGAWQVGRGVGKLQAIADSIALDDEEPDRVNMMLKKEVCIVRLEGGPLPKKARGIQFCTNLRTAYQNAAEQYSFGESLARATVNSVAFRGVLFNVVYTADMTPKQIAAFATAAEIRRSSFPYSFLDERDGKNWDANVQSCHRHALADWYGEVNPLLGELARRGISVRGRYRQGDALITYEVEGTVKSGHWDTSSGNAALNIEVTVRAITSLPLAIRPTEVRGLVMGDDLLLWLFFDSPVEPKDYAAAINKAERALGIDPVRGIFSDVLYVSFCSMTFYWTCNGSLAIVPKMGRTLAKLFWTVTPLQRRDPTRFASTIAHAFYPMYHGFQPMREFLKHHMHAPPLEMGDFNGEGLPYVMRTSEIPRWEGVHWLEGNLAKYDLLPGTLEEMPAILAAVGAAGSVKHPAVDLMIEADMSDPPERRGVLAC